MSSHDGTQIFDTSSSWAAACTSAHVGPIFVGGVELCDGPTASFLSHLSFESLSELSVSLSAPASMHFRISDGGFTAGNLLEGEGTILLRSYAAQSLGMVRVAGIPRMSIHCAMCH